MLVDHGAAVDPIKFGLQHSRLLDPPPSVSGPACSHTALEFQFFTWQYSSSWLSQIMLHASDAIYSSSQYTARRGWQDARHDSAICPGLTASGDAMTAEARHAARKAAHGTVMFAAAAGSTNGCSSPSSLAMPCSGSNRSSVCGNPANH